MQKLKTIDFSTKLNNRFTTNRQIMKIKSFVRNRFVNQSEAFFLKSSVAANRSSDK